MEEYLAEVSSVSSQQKWRYICTLWNSKVSVDIPEYFIGASLSGPHTSELNGGFSIYVYKYIYVYQRVGRLSM